jgi:hypothetical protein
MRRYPLDIEKKAIAPVILSGTLAKNMILRTFIATLPIPIPTINRLVRIIDIPATP